MARNISKEKFRAENSENRKGNQQEPRAVRSADGRVGGTSQKTEGNTK